MTPPRPTPATTCPDDILDRVIETIGLLCELDSVDLDDPAFRLALLIEITHQADARMLDTITAARDHGYSHHDIRRIIGLDP